MFNQITWAGYCTALLILLLFYYLCILLFFFKYDIILVISGKKKLFTSPRSAKAESNFNWRKNNSQVPENKSFDSETIASFPRENDGKYKFYVVHEFTHELQQTIQKASTHVYKKEELIFSLQLVLKKYPQLRDTNFTEAINNLIATECQNSCSIPLNEDEVNMLWL